MALNDPTKARGVKARVQSKVVSRTAFQQVVTHTYINLRRPDLKYIIIESVDSISRDGTDTPIYVIHYKSQKNSALINYQDFKLIHS